MPTGFVTDNVFSVAPAWKPWTLIQTVSEKEPFTAKGYNHDPVRLEI